MRGNRVRCILLLALAAGIYVWTNNKLSFYLLVLMLVLIVFALVSNLTGTRYLTAEAVTTDSGELHDGANGCVRIRLKNRSIFPLFRIRVCLVMRNLLTGSGCEDEEYFFLLPLEEREEVIEAESLYIGRVETDIVSLEGIDAFGLSRCRAASVSRGSYDRYPEPELLQEDLAQTKTESSKSLDRYLHRKGNDPSEVLDIREYQRGDSVKRIHWKLSAKMRQTMVRELDMPSDQDTLVVFGIDETESGRQIHRVISCALNVSWNLLKQEVHHSFIVLSGDGSLQQNYDITSLESYRNMEERVLAGNISVSAEDTNAYIEQHHILNQYSHVFYITDVIPEYRLSEEIEYMTPEVDQLCRKAS